MLSVLIAHFRADDSSLDVSTEVQAWAVSSAWVHVLIACTADGASCAVQYERHVDMRPQYFLGHAQPQQEQSSAQKAAAKSVSNDDGSASVGAVNGLKDVIVSTRVTDNDESCKLPVVYK